MPNRSTAAAAASTGVLIVLMASQFLMILDSSVMNVSMATVADDLDTTITGIQTAITMYMLVMASTMITGGKLGALWGRKRTFGIGLVVYGIGSFITAIAPNLGVLLFGWSLVEGLGAALILPAIVALVASNFPAQKRTSAYGMIAAAGAIAVAAGPIIGGAVSTYASWRYVFAGESLIVLIILTRMRKLDDTPPTSTEKLDLVGSGLTVLGLGSIVYGVLRSSEWGWVNPTPDGPSWLGLSPVIWLIAAGGVVLWAFARWETHVEAAGREPLLRMNMFENRELVGGLAMFFSQYMVQAGVFFALPLFLSIVLEYDPMQTGLRLLPVSIALLLSASLVPKLFTRSSPRGLVQAGLCLMAVGCLMLMAGMDPGAGAEVLSVPLVLIGLGLGVLASQLGAVTVSAVPESQSPEVGGLQNTASNLGGSLGTALIGSVLIAALSASFLTGVQNNPDVPASVKTQIDTELTGSVPFVSDSSLKASLDAAGVPPDAADAIVAENQQARLDGLRVAFGLAALLSIAALFLTGRLPQRPVGSAEPAGADAEAAPGPAPA